MRHIWWFVFIAQLAHAGVAYHLATKYWLHFFWIVCLVLLGGALMQLLITFVIWIKQSWLHDYHLFMQRRRS